MAEKYPLKFGSYPNIGDPTGQIKSGLKNRPVEDPNRIG